jgi:hypothetical protein
MNTTTITTRHGRQVCVTTTIMIEPRTYAGIVVDRAIRETRTFDGDHTATLYHLSNGHQYVVATSVVVNEIISGK